MTLLPLRLLISIRVPGSEDFIAFTPEDLDVGNGRR